ncbi:MAG: aminotransferase class V-fold PLP-dependent enzyme [Alphaproteobacteria bacterium]|nr:MAG: aminotransferase class V-fold PLP-dependent enzyme [Alphaproteobacteria bacterium]
MTCLKKHFNRTFDRPHAPLHFAAHSHHPWPDVSFEAHAQAWTDAAIWLDQKWETVVPQQENAAKAHIARLLNLSSPGSVVFGQNTHEFLLRLLSCFETGTVRILTTSSEFHSLSRQLLRLEEAGQAEVTYVDCAPFETFTDRIAEAAAKGSYDLIYVSHVFFDSGFVFDGIEALISATPSTDTFIVIDGYHSFMAMPVDLSTIEARCFYLAGGYKYAMAGEGVCFMHCPPGYGPAPVNTGWYAAFGDLAETRRSGVPYAKDAQRFKGATYDPCGLYRFNAVQNWLLEIGESPLTLWRSSMDLQTVFRDHIKENMSRHIRPDDLISLPQRTYSARFLTFEFGQASDLQATLMAQNIITDCRGNRLRIGFAPYQDEDDVGRLITFL